MTDNNEKGTLQYALKMINMTLPPNKTFHPGKKHADKNRYYHFKRVAYIVELTQGKYMICDESQKTRELLQTHTWYYDGHGYAKTTANGKTKSFHRIALTYESGLVADHINRYRLDNRLDNLRIVTPQINARNLSRSSKNKTGKIGVSRCVDIGLIGYRVLIADPEHKLTHAGRYRRSFFVGQKSWNPMTKKCDDYVIKTEEDALARAIEHRLFIEGRLGYLGE